MLEGPFALALATGMAATVNPCGFALLPAYLSAFVGLDAGDGAPAGSRSRAVLRAIKVSVVLTAGFVTVFGLFGLIVSPLSIRFEERLPWVTIVIGLCLVVLGVAMLLGRQLTVNLPKLNKGGADGTLVSMYLFGVSYAVASLSCAIATFLAVTAGSFRAGNLASGVVLFVLYGVGMGIVVGVLTVAVALAREGVVARFRSWLPTVNRVAGGLLVVAGAYVAYYGWYQLRVFAGGDGRDPIVDNASKIRHRLLVLLPDDGNAAFYTLMAVALLVAVVLGVRWLDGARRRTVEPGDVEDPERVGAGGLTGG